MPFTMDFGLARFIVEYWWERISNKLRWNKLHLIPDATKLDMIVCNVGLASSLFSFLHHSSIYNEDFTFFYIHRIRTFDQKKMFLIPFG